MSEKLYTQEEVDEIIIGAYSEGYNAGYRKVEKDRDTMVTLKDVVKNMLKNNNS